VEVSSIYKLSNWVQLTGICLPSCVQWIFGCRGGSNVEQVMGDVELGMGGVERMNL